jgi:hypothetical protein
MEPVPPVMRIFLPLKVSSKLALFISITYFLRRNF